jgi:CO/xanthine dehydrogenase FAD-binding subunit
MAEWRRDALRLLEAEQAVEGRGGMRGCVRRAKDVVSRTLRPISDHRGSAAYRVWRWLLASLLEKEAA